MSNTQLRVLVALVAIALYALTSFVSPQASLSLSFPLLFLVIVAPTMRDSYRQSEKEIVVMSVALIGIGLIGSVFHIAGLLFMMSGLGLPSLYQVVLNFAERAQPVIAHASQMAEQRQQRTNTQRKRDAVLAKQQLKQSQAKK
jgi:hypothetical protein